MGRYVEIKKIAEEGSVHSYSVQSPDYADTPVFYIKINALERMVAFYRRAGDRQADFIAHMGHDLAKAPDWLPSLLVYATLKKAWEAIKNNELGAFISFQS